MTGEHMKVLKGPTTMLYPCPVALVTCTGGSGKDDIVTLAWVGVADSTPPIITAGIRPTRYSAGLINKSREFVVNIPTVSLLEKVDYCGSVSGFDVKKFETTGLTREHASKVKAPMIKECPVNLECKLRRTILLGSHRLYLGEVLETHIEESIIDSKGGIDYEKAQPFVYNAREYWSMGKNIGLYGFSKGMLRQS